MIVLYLDLLGFSNHVFTSLEDANRLLSTYITNLNFKSDNFFRSGQINQHSISSFKNFLPFSDSIFITSDDESLFLPQISQFLLDSFMYHGNELRFPADPANPHRVNIKDLSIENDKVIVTEITENWLPLLFRGGLSTGVVTSGLVPSISNFEKTRTQILTGIPVVNSVRLEQSGQQGPRILVDSNATELFTSYLIDNPLDNNSDTKELYWPGVIFYNSENPDIDIHKYTELLDISIILWKAYRISPTVERHYFNFVKLVYKSARLAFLHYQWDLQKLIDATNQCFLLQGITDAASFLD